MTGRPRLLDAPRRWRLPGGIRRQSALAAVAVVAGALLIGGLLFLQVLTASLSSALRTSMTHQADDAAAIVAGSGPRGLAASDRLDRAAVEGTLQVVDGKGKLAYTSRVTGHVLSTLRPAPGAQEIEGLSGGPVPGEEPVTVAEGVRYDGEPFVVLVTSSQEDQRHAVRTVAIIFVLASPLLLALTGGATWWLTGRALRPVEDIRGAVSEIEYRDLARRVDVPSTHDEIEALATTMNRMLLRLEVAQSGQRRFVSDASHELRSPLASLSASLEIARAAPEAQAWPALLDIMDDEVGRMRHLVDDLLLLAKADDRGMASAREDVDLDDIVAAEARRLRASGRCTVQASIEPARVVGDVAKLTQVLRNLCDNAERAASSQVRLALCVEGDEVVIDVDDDGAGVPEAERARVFERFVRLDDARSRDLGGSGLGLAIVAEIVAVHGGSVQVGEAPGLGGARFEVRLPVPREDGPPRAEGPHAEPPPRER